MTKKDYIIIAKVINTAISEATKLPSISPPEKECKTAIIVTAMEIAKALATVMEKDNPRFNRQRFLDACLVPNL